MKTNDKLHRRDFLKWTAVAAGSAALTYGTFFHRRPDDTSSVELVRKGDASKPMRQEDVDLEYERLYNEIQTAKRIAGKKKLVILLGDSHQDKISALHEMIITDIAARLGIKDAIIEQPKNDFEGIVQSARDANASFLKAFKTRAERRP